MFTLQKKKIAVPQKIIRISLALILERQNDPRFKTNHRDNKKSFSKPPLKSYVYFKMTTRISEAQNIHRKN